MDRLNAMKTVVVEPRSSGVAFEKAMNNFYSAVRSSVQSGGNRHGGALFLAVCRGKVSEGLDFADENARGVLIVGIPFPNIKDLQISQKRDYNSRNSHRNLLDGSQWYDLQAWRAVNQAVGRALRHRYDYGSIIFLDERFRQSNEHQLSKWLRGNIQRFDSFADSVKTLSGFFALLKDNPPVNPNPRISPTPRTSSNDRKRSNMTVGSSSEKKSKPSPSKGTIDSFFKAVGDVSTQSSQLNEPMASPSVASIEGPMATPSVPPIEEPVATPYVPIEEPVGTPTRSWQQNGILVLPHVPSRSSSYFSSGSQSAPTKMSSSRPSPSPVTHSSPFQYPSSAQIPTAEVTPSSSFQPKRLDFSQTSHLCCKRCHSSLAQLGDNDTPIPIDKLYFHKIVDHVTQTSSPQVLSYSLPTAFSLKPSQLSLHCRPTNEPLYSKTTISSTFHPYAPLSFNSGSTSVWIPSDGIAYVPYFCQKCSPLWCVGVQVKAADSLHQHLLDQIWIASAAVFRI